MTFAVFPGPTPGGGRRRPRQGVWPGGSGALGGPGTDPPAHRSPPPARHPSPDSRFFAHVPGRVGVGQDDVRGVAGPHPRGVRRRPRQGVWPGGSGALGAPGTDPPAPRGPPTDRHPSSDFRFFAHVPGRVGVGQDDVRGVPGPAPGQSRRRPRQGVWPGGSGALRGPGTDPPAPRGPPTDRHPSPDSRFLAHVPGRVGVGQDDVRGVAGPHPRGVRRRPRQGVWPGGSGALGGPGTDPPAPQTAGPDGHPSPDSRFLAHVPGRVGVGQDDVRGVPGPAPGQSRRRPRQGVWPGGSGALGAPGTDPPSPQTAGPDRHPSPDSRFLAHKPGRVGVGQDDVRGVAGPAPGQSRRRPRQGVWPGGSGALGGPGTDPPAPQTAGPDGHPSPDSRFLAHVPGRVGVGQDDVRGVAGPHPRGVRRRPRQGVWPGGSGALGAPGTDPPAPQTAGPDGHPSPDSRFLAHVPGRVGVGQDDVRGVPGPDPGQSRRRPRQGVWPGGSGALGGPGTVPPAPQTAGPDGHPSPDSRFLAHVPGRVGVGQDDVRGVPAPHPRAEPAQAPAGGLARWVWGPGGPWDRPTRPPNRRPRPTSEPGFPLSGPRARPGGSWTG